MNQQQGIEYTKKPYVEDVGPRKIESLKFSMLSGAEIMKAAEVQVWLGRYYDTSIKPHENGLLDQHMGPANRSGTCATCHGGYADCPGHYGYLKLTLPVYNVGYLSTILDILKCICKFCSRVILDDKLYHEYLKKMRNPKLDPLKKSELMKQIVKKCSTMASSNKEVTCFKCGYINGTVKKVATSGFGISHDRPKVGDKSLEECKKAIYHLKESVSPVNKSNILYPTVALSLFKRMLDEDCELLYLSDRPEKLIMTSMAVPPTAIRPSVIIDGSQSNENDITEKLKMIIQSNAKVSKGLEDLSSVNDFMGFWETLQVDVSQYINSDVRSISQFPAPLVPAKKLAGFLQRLKGKHGRFRGNLSGKRVEFTGRTVISPDPNLKITEVAIPIHMARILTFPERVSHHNIEKLRQCVANGLDKYPGAFQVRNSDGEKWHLGGGYRKRIADKLKFGDIVDRHLQDGDVILFNRQPSLHRMSIMAHRVRVMPWRTLRFNESVCNPYNADFDGDEMNMHVPQTEEARTEALTLMGVQNNLCTPKNGEILVAPTQDFLTSSFLITRKDTFYDRSAFSLMCSYMGDGMDAVDLPTPTIIKPIELWTGKQLFSVLVRPHTDMRVYVNLIMKEKNYSKLKQGEREVETMCPNDGFVYFRNSELISGQLGKVTLGNGNKDGLFSVLLRDYNAHAAASCMNRIAKLSARWIGNHGFSIGIDDVQPGFSLNNRRMDTIMECFKKCDQLQKPSKGKLNSDLTDVETKLENDVTKELNEVRDRIGKVLMETLHWRNSPKIMSQCGSKGSPMNIAQMIGCVGQQSVGGRRVSYGFIGRGLPHFPGKEKIPQAKGFVVNSFYSGLRATEFFFHTMGGREGLVDTAVKTADTGYMSRRLIKALEDLFVHYDNTVRNASGCIVQFLYGDDSMDPATMEGESGFPLNFDRLFLKVKATCPADEDKYLSASEITEIVKRRISGPDMDLANGYTVSFKKSLEGFLNKRVEILNKTRERLGLIDNYVGCENSKILEEAAQKISGITSKQLQVFFDICIHRYCLKKIEAGCSIGAIGAQSIGEPGTQMTLKTFHFAGVASMNVTLGVPRIKEIIDGAKNIKTPIITARLESDDCEKFAEDVKRRIEVTTLGQVAKSMKDEYNSMKAVIRISLDKKKIRELNISIDANDVKRSILQTPRIKLKAEDINVRDMKLEVTLSNIFKRHSLKEVLKAVIIKGMRTAKCTAVDHDRKNKKNKVLVEVSEGKGLLAIMGTEGIDGRKTRSNHVMEVQKTLGIEAARTCIIDEIMFVMKEMRIDIRHMMLLADAMTFRGEVLGITRFGIQKMGKSVLMLSSFEKTGDHLFNASVNGREDKIEGVSECIIMGIPIPIGSGIIKVKQRNMLKEPRNSMEKDIKDKDQPGAKIQEIKLSQGLDPIIH